MRKAAFTILVLGSVLLICAHRVEPVYYLNLSKSAPRGLYRREFGSISRGDWVVVLRSRIKAAKSYSPWLKTKRLLKQVNGLRGDKVCVKDKGVYVNGIKIAPVFVKDHKQRLLPRLRGCFLVKMGQIFLLNSKSLSSFDGRYFGLVKDDVRLVRQVIGFE